MADKLGRRTEIVEIFHIYRLVTQDAAFFNDSVPPKRYQPHIEQAHLAYAIVIN
jgi:hypothetical protein